MTDPAAFDGMIHLISNVGFPIAAFLMMFWLAHSTIRENTEALRDLKNEIRRLEQ